MTRHIDPAPTSSNPKHRCQVQSRELDAMFCMSGIRWMDLKGQVHKSLIDRCRIEFGNKQRVAKPLPLAQFLVLLVCTICWVYFQILYRQLWVRCLKIIFLLDDGLSTSTVSNNNVVITHYWEGSRADCTEELYSQLYVHILLRKYGDGLWTSHI